mmetsp:Transcript_53327/g.172103  ORF Transcript_53327/g.172103 Transcript_53327/m.172103 type:complete len:210 (+) Transcript_53327:580-1209(+)
MPSKRPRTHRRHGMASRRGPARRAPRNERWSSRRNGTRRGHRAEAAPRSPKCLADTPPGTPRRSLQRAPAAKSCSTATQWRCGAKGRGRSAQGRRHNRSATSTQWSTARQRRRAPRCVSPAAAARAHSVPAARRARRPRRGRGRPDCCSSRSRDELEVPQVRPTLHVLHEGPRAAAASAAASCRPARSRRPREERTALERARGSSRLLW